MVGQTEINITFGKKEIQELEDILFWSLSCKSADPVPSATARVQRDIMRGNAQKFLETIDNWKRKQRSKGD